ncbi:MAG: Hsp70 family protein [Candidatus Methylophosphatis roskildensis]
MSAPRYAIGIDLGTTNCALAYVDLQAPHGRAEMLSLPQLHAIDAVVDSPLLPSFFYYCSDAEMEQAQVDPISGLPDDEAPGYVVGVMARERMSALPGRVIHSAKSWLAHAGIDRETQMLPFGSDEIPADLRLSPLEASAAYLQYLKEAWDHAVAREHADKAFARQRIVVTVPASFDEAAQALTRKAAELAGYPPGLRLLEEPQAAFYAWLDGAGLDAAQAPGARLLECVPALAQEPQTVLVCDVGGGTSDFSLFRIAPLRSARERPAIERIAASEHLLLGGDNIDLALAHLLERQLRPDNEERLSRRQWMHLLPQARLLKERVLEFEGDPDQVFHVSLPGDGADLFRSVLDTTVSRELVQQTVIEGFFPLTGADERPLGRRAGLREIGLPYAADSAISRHLAAFLDGRPVDAVLFVGGVLRPPLLQQRLLALIERWQGRPAVQLALQDMSLAVARGAASFAALPDGAAERIGGGYPRSVYLELQPDDPDAMPELVCILPQGFEEGGRHRLAAPAFELLVNRPVRFSAYTSNRRPTDAAGSLTPLDIETFHPLPPLHATIVMDDENFNPRKAAEQSISVQIEVELTDLGVLRLALVNEAVRGRWELEFNLRKPLAAQASKAPDVAQAAEVAPAALDAAQARIARFYGSKQSLDSKDNVKSLARDLERIVGQDRTRWSLTLLRALWPALYPGITRRVRSPEHENAWLYLAGFLLRPGYGSELDPWRMTQLWECFDLGLAHRKDKSVQSSWWMMWRRTAGGLGAEQQELLFDSALPHFRRAAAQFVEGTRLLGSLERVAPGRKQELAALLAELIVKGKAANQPHVLWALARLLSRVPLYTAAESVLPAATVEEVFARLEPLDWNKLGLQQLAAVFSAACRLTGTRVLDIHDPVRVRVIDKLKRMRARPEQIRVVQEYCELSSSDRNELFGEALPAGLRLSTA